MSGTAAVVRARSIHDEPTIKLTRQASADLGAGAPFIAEDGGALAVTAPQRPRWLDRGLLLGFFSHAVLIVTSIAVLLPVLYVVKKAFTPGQEFAVSLDPRIPLGEFTLEHFRNVMGQPLFGRQLWNSVVTSLTTTVLGVTLACTAAYAFSRFSFPGRRAGLMSFLVSQMFPVTLLMIPLYIILDKLQLLDRLIGLVLVYSTTSIPFCVWMLKGYFDTIPRELEEAARIDGASRLGIFVRIVLPLARPAIVVTALFSFMTAWNEFILAETFMNRESSYTLPVALQHYVGEYSTQWGSFAAGAIIVSVPVMLLFFALQRHLIGGLTAGSVKG
jgi:arabinogalactan oligomer/maltooligosaccharide transport system permease protein